MIPLVNALACLVALGVASLLWAPKSSFYRNAGLWALFMLVACIFTYLGSELSETKNYDLRLEYYPFRMLALCLCLSTTSLRLYRRRYLVLAQGLWCWIELLGGMALYYRGLDVAWLRIVALMGVTLGSTFLSRISREMEFCLMVFWLAIWVFF